MFKLKSEFAPCGDQPQAIKQIVESIKNGNRFQTLLGVTGSGKTFTMAKVIEELNRPTLVLAHNKTLAAQLCSEFKEFFPENAVEYFVSYYDYYQPEAYIASTDTYIEKDSSINDEIDRLRHSATISLFERRDVIIVASVSCIYGLGDPEDYTDLVISLRPGMIKDRDSILRKLVEIQYERNEIDFTRGCFRVKGDTLDVFPSNTSENIMRIQFFGDEIERILSVDPLTGEILGEMRHCAIFPASHYVTTTDKMAKAVKTISAELEERIRYFEMEGKLLEAQRIAQRTNYDIEMLEQIGFCPGIENYSRHISGREPGSCPYTLIDYFPDDFILMIDESHVTLPQVRGMYAGDRSRKESLVDNGFRLPSAFDNRPLNYEEFMNKIGQTLFVSATPAKQEKELSAVTAEQIIRPTGLLDPEITVVPTKGQIDHLESEIRNTVCKGEKVLITTLTKRMAEDLTEFYTNAGLKVRYLHSDVDTLERIEIIRGLRIGVFDVLIGINLLREGLDIPEVSLIAILDADKEGFLRTETSLIQTIGRAARNVNGRVIMYADEITPSMKNAIEETERRRKIQDEYNKENNIIPKSVTKSVREIIEITKAVDQPKKKMSKREITETVAELTRLMEAAAKDLDFESAAVLRDRIIALKGKENG